MKEVNQRHINGIITAIQEKLTEKKAILSSSLGSRNGLAGLSLFYFALFEYNKDEIYKTLGEDTLALVFDHLNEGYRSGDLYRELAEIGWMIENLAGFGLGPSDTNDVLDDFDAILIEMMRSEMVKKNFDPITGALAYGNYLLKRMDSQPALEAEIRELVQFILTVSYENEQGVFWKSKLKNDDSIYLGITHGSANLILFLTYAKKKIPDLAIEATIQKACQYLLASRHDHPYLVFPIVVGEKYERNVFPKHFCYGDYGTLYGLFEGYNFLTDATNKAFCLSLFKEIYNRGHDAPFLVAGPSLLYGTAGLAMIFKRFYELTDLELFETAYQEKINELVNSFDPSAPYLGYKGYWNQEEPYTNYSLAQGLIGIGLALMADSNPKIRSLYEGFFYMRPF